jgi:lysylphosphatidylglycerol synthetase-like protein (DUF2156 family)
VVSDAWLASKNVPEKRFSVGFFSEPFLRRFPAIVAETPDGRIVAFASAGEGVNEDCVHHAVWRLRFVTHQVERSLAAATTWH